MLLDDASHHYGQLDDDKDDANGSSTDDDVNFGLKSQARNMISLLRIFQDSPYPI